MFRYFRRYFWGLKMYTPYVYYRRCLKQNFYFNLYTIFMDRVLIVYNDLDLFRGILSSPITPFLGITKITLFHTFPNFIWHSHSKMLTRQHFLSLRGIIHYCPNKERVLAQVKPIGVVVGNSVPEQCHLPFLDITLRCYWELSKVSLHRIQ